MIIMFALVLYEIQDFVFKPTLLLLKKNDIYVILLIKKLQIIVSEAPFANLVLTLMLLIFYFFSFAAKCGICNYVTDKFHNWHFIQAQKQSNVTSFLQENG